MVLDTDGGSSGKDGCEQECAGHVDEEEPVVEVDDDA